MSVGSKITLGASVVFTASIITYVHVKQKKDREFHLKNTRRYVKAVSLQSDPRNFVKASLHEGVVRDLQRQEMKKRQNIKMLQDQIELTKVLQAQRDADMELHRQQQSSTNITGNR